MSAWALTKRQVSTTTKLTYDIPGWQCRSGASATGYVIVDQVVVTLEDDGMPTTDDTGPYMDYDTFGVAATSKGQPDKRSRHALMYVSRTDHAWLDDLIREALASEGWTTNEDGSYTIAR